MSYIQFSEHESQIHKLRIGRSEILKNFEMDSLIDEIFSLNLDLCRIKLDISSLDAFYNIEQLCLPYGIYTLLIKQTFELDKLNLQEIPANIRMEAYDLSKKEELNNLVLQILKEDTMNAHYENETLQTLLTKESIKNVIADFQTTFSPELDENKACYLAYLNDKLMGYCTMQFKEDQGEGVFVGILPEYRSNDFFKYFIQKEMQESKYKNCKTYSCSTIAFNARSLNTSLRLGMKVDQLILNFNIFSLFDKINSGSINFEANFFDLQHKCLTKFLEEKILKEAIVIEFKLKIRKPRIDTSHWHAIFHKEQSIIIFHDEQRINYGFMKIDLLSA
jgi:hypothetical protein